MTIEFVHVEQVIDEGIALGRAGRLDEAAEMFRRSGVRIPGGELMLETQARMIQQIECLTARHPGETVAVVSHGDPLRAAIAYFLGIALDLVLRLEVSPASCSVLQVDEWGARVLCINDTGEVPS